MYVDVQQDVEDAGDNEVDQQGQTYEKSVSGAEGGDEDEGQEDDHAEQGPAYQLAHLLADLGGDVVGLQGREGFREAGFEPCHGLLHCAADLDGVDGFLRVYSDVDSVEAVDAVV